MFIEGDIKLDFDDVLLVPQRSLLVSRSQVELTRSFEFYWSPRKWTGIPIMAANMSCIAGFQLARALQKHKMITCLHKYYRADQLVEEFSKDDIDLDYVWVSIGFSALEKERLVDFSAMMNGLQPNICIDVPNAYIQPFVDYCREIRYRFPNSIIMAGNMVTAEICQELIIHGGVDICKIGIGCGKRCITKNVTGVSYPQLAAAGECAKVVHGLKIKEKKLGLICSDGGIKEVGDVCKAFGVGSDFIMMGSFFGGVDENSDVCEWITKEDDSQEMVIYGMSSHYAQLKHGEGKKNYRASEGKVDTIPYRGSINDILPELFGGIRSCCTYIGAESVKDMSKCARFIRIVRR